MKIFNEKLAFLTNKKIKNYKILLQNRKNKNRKKFNQIFICFFFH